MPITITQLKQILGPAKIADTRLQLITKALNETFVKYDINSNRRQCHFLAQVLHETSAFQFTSEIWYNNAAQKKYDTRADLGNSPAKDGDGYKYRGRGWIQLTGKVNYSLLSGELKKDFIKEPDLLAKEPYNALSAGWFWKKKNLNAAADNDDITSLTRKINGGFNGLNDRKSWLNKAKSVLTY